MTGPVATSRLGDLFDFQNGRAFQKSEWSSKGLPIIRIQNLNNAQAPFNFFAGSFDEKILVEQDDLLFSWSGTVGSSFGSHLYSGETGVLNQHIFKVGIRGPVTKRYAWYALRHITEEIEQSVSGAVGLVHITKEKLNEFRIPVPQTEEQHRIVRILDEAFEGIATAKANAERNVANARVLFESELESATSTPQDGRSEQRFDEVCEITSTLVDPRKSAYLDLIHVGAGNIESKTGALFDLKTSKEEGLISGKFLFDSSMVLYSKIRPYLMKVARPNFEGLCSADMYPLAPRRGVVTRDFLYHILMSKTFTEYAVQGSARAGMPKVNRDHLFQYRLTLPGINQQEKISARLDELHVEVDRLSQVYERKVLALDALKKSLLHRAFTGQL